MYLEFEVRTLGSTENFACCVLASDVQQSAWSYKLQASQENKTFSWKFTCSAQNDPSCKINNTHTIEITREQSYHSTLIGDFLLEELSQEEERYILPKDWQGTVAVTPTLNGSVYFYAIRELKHFIGGEVIYIPAIQQQPEVALKSLSAEPNQTSLVLKKRKAEAALPGNTPKISASLEGSTILAAFSMPENKLAIMDGTSQEQAANGVKTLVDALELEFRSRARESSIILPEEYEKCRYLVANAFARASGTQRLGLALQSLPPNEPAIYYLNENPGVSLRIDCSEREARVLEKTSTNRLAPRHGGATFGT